MHESSPVNVTSTGIAVAAAVVIAIAFIFFGPNILAFFNPGLNKTQAQTATTTALSTATSTMTDQSQSDISLSDIPANPTQLLSKDIVVGTGAEAKAGDQVTVNYVGMLTNGQVFDASSNHGSQGFTFTLGAGQVIKGWDQGVAGMKVGGKRELIIPASLGYGTQAVGPIPANSTLVFEVELTNVQAAK